MEYIGFFKNEYLYYKDIESDEIGKTNNFPSLCRSGGCTFFLANIRVGGKVLYKQLLKKGFKPIRKKKERQVNSIYIKENVNGVIYEIDIYINKNNFARLKNIELLSNGRFDIQKDKSIVFNQLKRTLLALKKIGCTNSSLPSYALKDFLKQFGKGNYYRFIYPKLSDEVTEEMRKAYNHGIYYISKDIINYELNDGVTIDITSLYPYILKNYALPFGYPERFEGKYKKDNYKNIYIQEFRACIELKKNGVDYIDPEQGGFLPICHFFMTNYEIDNLYKNYNVKVVEWLGGWKFKSVQGLFTKFVDKWFEIKKSAKQDGNYKMTLFSKTILNSLVGQFGRRNIMEQRMPKLSKNGDIIYKFYKKKTWSLYLPVAIFVVDIGRSIILENARKIKEYSTKKYHVDKYIYSDTDSIATTLSLDELRGIVEIDGEKLGTFKVESIWRKATFFGIKSYCIKENGGIKTHVSGLKKEDIADWLERHNIKF